MFQNLKSEPLPWMAHFHAVVEITTPKGQTLFLEGKCSGEIISVELGSGGFGYDPIFYLPKLKRTMAELTMDEKNRLSHRAKAIKKAIPILKEVLGM